MPFQLGIKSELKSSTVLVCRLNISLNSTWETTERPIIILNLLIKNWKHLFTV